MSEKNPSHQQRGGGEKNEHKQHQQRGEEEKVGLAWSHPAHEQVQAATCWKVSGHLEKDHRRGIQGEDLEPDLEEACWLCMWSK